MEGRWLAPLPGSSFDRNMLAGRTAQRPQPLTAVLGGVYLPFAQAEVMADLVPNRIGDDALQVNRIARHIFVGALEDTDAVGAVGGRIAQTALSQRAALVKTEQVGGGADWLDDDHQIPHPGAKSAGNGGDGAFHHRVEGFGCEP